MSTRFDPLEGREAVTLRGASFAASPPALFSVRKRAFFQGKELDGLAHEQTEMSSA